MKLMMAISILLAGCMNPIYLGLLYDLAHEPHEANNCLAKARRYRECLGILGVDAFIRVQDRHAVVILPQADGTHLIVDPTTGRWYRWRSRTP